MVSASMRPASGVRVGGSSEMAIGRPFKPGAWRGSSARQTPRERERRIVSIKRIARTSSVRDPHRALPKPGGPGFPTSGLTAVQVLMASELMAARHKRYTLRYPSFSSRNVCTHRRRTFLLTLGAPHLCTHARESSICLRCDERWSWCRGVLLLPSRCCTGVSGLSNVPDTRPARRHIRPRSVHTASHARTSHTRCTDSIL